MPNELGPFREAVKLVIFNPDVSTQVRQVSGAGSPAWVELSAPPVFSECVVEPQQIGTTGFYFADLPAGLVRTEVYLLAVYAATADSFDDVASEAKYTDTAAASNFHAAAANIVTGVVGPFATTTIIPLKTPALAVADQLKGRIVIFDRDTATAALRGQATDITSSTTASLNVTALSTAPAEDDTLTIQ